MNTLDGQKIIRIGTLKSRFDGDCLFVIDDEKNEYRLPCSTIMSMVNEFIFDSVMKRKYSHLVVNWDETRRLKCGS